jgi:hypothetical protein
MYHAGIMHAAYTGSVNEKIGKVMADAVFTALVAFLFGVFLAGTIKKIDGVPVAATVFCGASAIFGIFWTRRALQRLLTVKYTMSETAKRSARQLAVFCFSFAVNSVTFGLEVMGAVHYSSDGFYLFSACVLGILTCVWFYCVHQQARRLTSALV